MTAPLRAVATLADQAADHGWQLEELSCVRCGEWVEVHAFPPIHPDDFVCVDCLRKGTTTGATPSTAEAGGRRPREVTV